MGNIADKVSNSLKLRFKRLGSHIVPFGTFICGSLRHQQKIKSMTFKPCFTDTHLIRAPVLCGHLIIIYGQFALFTDSSLCPWRKESPYISSKFNPLYTGTSLTMAPSVSALTKFDCNDKEKKVNLKTNN